MTFLKVLLKTLILPPNLAEMDVGQGVEKFLHYLCHISLFLMNQKQR